MESLNKKIVGRFAAAVSIFFFAANAGAVVADHFKCNLEIQNSVPRASTSQVWDFSLARIPLSASPSPDVRMTAAQAFQAFKLNLPHAQVGANLNFYYKHAVRLSPAGKPVEARQFTCIAISGNYCPHTTQSPSPSGSTDTNKGDLSSGNYLQKEPLPIDLCSDSTVVCSEPQDPFNAKTGWSPTQLLQGVPIFNPQVLGGTAASYSDQKGQPIGSIVMSCEFLGSIL